MNKLSKRSYERLNGIDAILIAILTEGIKESPYDFGIPRDGGLRTAERQKELFDKKVSKADGYKKKSYHQTGKAFDIYIYENGSANWDKEKLVAVGKHLIKIAKEQFNINLEHGANWTSWQDYPHFQIK